MTGKVLLRRALGGPPAGGVVTYNARGVQNVAIVSGFVGIYNSIASDIGGGNTTVTVFRLGGKMRSLSSYRRPESHFR